MGSADMAPRFCGPPSPAMKGLPLHSDHSRLTVHGLFDVLAVKVPGYVGIAVEQVTGETERVALQRTLEGE